jgi:hypothetical protein
MEWIIATLACFVLAVLVALSAARARGPKDIHIPGRFNFDGYKESELSQRGVQDKTKWR